MTYHDRLAIAEGLADYEDSQYVWDLDGECEWDRRLGWWSCLVFDEEIDIHGDMTTSEIRGKQLYLYSIWLKYVVN